MLKLDCFIEEIELHIKRVEAILPDIKKWIPFQRPDFDDTEKVKTIDSFIYRLTKIQDKIGDKFFPEVLESLQEYKSNMSFIDVLNRLERLELIESTDEWIDFRKLRNTLTHEYPNNEDEIIEAVGQSVVAYEKVKQTYNNIIEYLKEKK